MTNLRVHNIRSDICISDVLSVFASELRLDLLEVQWSKARTGPAVDSGLVPNDLATEGFREATNRLSEVTLEELNDRRGEVQLICTGDNVVFGDVVLGHPLSKVTNDL